MPKSKHFTVSEDSSPPTPPSGVAQASKKNGSHSSYSPSEEHTTTTVAAGRLSEEVYTNILPWWRAELRRKTVSIVEWESQVIAQWQTRIRSPWLDTYFLQTSMLGTHTFFLIFIPGVYMFGPNELGRGLCYALTIGVYLSSFLKDLVCSPRPYTPPVTRLTIGSHHLEYGFPSTHSTNCMSMALFLGAHVHDLHRAGSLSTTAFATWVTVLVVYVSSVVGGRLYTGMHGFLDVSVGVILGGTAWTFQRVVMPEVERWMIRSGWTGPLTLTLVCLLLVNQHPAPVDDCPCFEDAIACVSVILGTAISFWYSKRVPALNVDLFNSAMPAFDSPAAIATWVLLAILKLTTGILVIFAWRMLAKPAVQTLLPPLFRWLAHASPVRLPHRRHYTPATEYSHGPSHTLRAVPSMIDLDLAVAEVVDEGSGGVASGRAGRTTNSDKSTIKRRGTPEKSVVFEAHEGGALEDNDKVKHYDADVLTKVVVYAGIGALSAVLVPAMFVALEWGV